MGITPLDRLLMWFNRPRTTCWVCGVLSPDHSFCSDECGKEYADSIA